MLKIKFFKEFKAGQPFLVVISNKEGFQDAHDFFVNKKGAFLNDQGITEFSDISPLDKNSLRMSEKECHDISERFKNLYESGEPGHVYFDIVALGDEVEVIISYNEYDDLF